jgi:hypothetical protein
MTNDQILEMANEAKKTADNPSEWSIAFARLIEKQVKNIDARIAEDYHDSTNEYVDGYEIAAAIRNSGGAA